MSRPMKKMLIILCIVFGIIFGWYAVKKLVFFYFMSHYKPPAVTVSAAHANSQNWQSYLTSVGTLTAVNGVDISAQTSGIVKEIRFTSGQFVSKGDILVLLDSNVEEAQLKDNLAQAKLSQLNYERHKTLTLKHAVAQSTLDTLTAQLDQALAGVEQTKAKIQQKIITAPFSGKIGIRSIDIGQFVSAGTAMVTLQSLDPLYVQFTIPEQYINQLYLQQPVSVNVNLANGKILTGSITAINSKVDQITRNILVQATVPNADMQIYPGMFALVKVFLREHKNVVVVPQTAITYSLHGDAVYLIKTEGKDKKGKPLLKAYKQYIKLGERRDNEVAVLEGLKSGDSVVTAGQLKLQNGTSVVIDNSVGL